MIIKERFIKTLVAISASIMLMLPLAGCGKSKNIESGSTWEVTETTKLSSLTIADGAQYHCPGRLQGDHDG